MTTRVAHIYLPEQATVCPRPLFLVPVSAGYPSPADDYLDGKLDLNFIISRLITRKTHPHHRYPMKR
jgi:hypothetical protein